jgi:tRNA A37 threonylcarbamoyladenosine dehydratase
MTLNQTFGYQWERTEQLIGRTGLEKLHRSRVAVVGLGGVGSFALESLVRAGVGSLVLVDYDRLEPSNLNRQLLALNSTLGQLKVEAARERARDINPAVDLTTWPVFCNAENCFEILYGKLDYVIDAIDVVSSKVTLIRAARELGIPVASAMGAGNKLDPTAFRIADLKATTVCPLARAVRRELRRIGIEDGIKTVYSVEPPHRSSIGKSGGKSAGSPVKPTGVGSISFVPAVAGLLLAGLVIQDLLEA